MTQYSAVGFKDLYLVLADSNGFAVGGLTTPSAGASGDPYRWHGAFSMPTSLPAPNALNVEGDDTVIAIYQFPANELPTGTIEMSSEDPDIISTAQGTNTVTVGGSTIFLRNPQDLLLNQKFYFVQHKLAQTVPGSLPRYKTEVFFGTLTDLGQASSSQGDDKFQYSVAYSRMAQYPWGLAMVDGTEGTTAASSIVTYSPYLWTIGTAQGDATALVVDLLFAPYEDSADAAVVYVDGVLQTYTTDYTVDIVNAQITFQVGSEPASGAEIVIWYGYSA